MDIYPTEIERTQPQVIRIAWNDGKIQNLTAQALRDQCPCASCREKHSASPPPASTLPILSSAETRPLQVASMRPVGNYAYAVTFSDGHKNGIFTFELLRQIGVDVVAWFVMALLIPGVMPSRPLAWSQSAVAEPDAPAVPEGLNDAFLDKNLDPDEWVERFEVESREIYAARREIVDRLDLKPGMRIGDIGSGTGLFVPLFADKVGSHGQVYAVDISPKLVEFVRERAQKAGLKQVDVIQCEADDARLPSSSIDVAFICDTYHHFEHPQATLQSLRFALRPGGQLVVIDFERIPGTSRDWVIDHVRAGKEVFRKEIEQAGFVFVDEVAIGPFHENYFLRFRRP